MNLFEVLLNTLKARVLPIFTRLTLLLNPRFLLARLTEGLRTFITKVLNIKPRNKDDYYPMGGWLVSKKLAYAVVIIIAIVCVIYIVTQRNALFPGSSEEHISTYNYNSILLKFAKGRVRIKGASGWIAYDGEVSDAACNGNGTLRNPQGVVIYEGNFASNMYEDKGIQYYDNGILHYEGEFHQNLYSGKGSLFRETGSLEYEGEFLRNMKDGEGVLYDVSGSEIFSGQFSQDKVLYSSLLGKSSTEMAIVYSGKRKLYESDAQRVRVLEDLGVMTEEITDADSVDSAATVSAVYVLENSIRIGNTDYTTFDGIEQALGVPTYVGDSMATLPELLIINRLNEASPNSVLNGSAEIVSTDMFTEYTQVSDYDTDYSVYLHSYEKDGLVYNFVSAPSDQTFSFYYILKRNGSDDVG